MVAAAGWWVSGGRWMVVATPSMGRAAPVGTLVLTRPVLAAELRVGDVISFRSPTTASRTYTHRVVLIDTSGGLHTRGDINGAQDPGVLRSRDVIGKVVARWWAVGWLLRALPWLLLGGSGLWWLPRRWAPWQHRRPIRVFGVSLVVSAAAFLLKPFVGLVQITNMPTAGGAELTVVSTGILPLRLTATGGAHIDLVDGQVGALTATGPAGPGGYRLTAGLHLNLWWWILLITVWLSPLLVALLIPPARGPRPQPTPAGPAGPPPTAPRNAHRSGAAVVNPAAGVEPGTADHLGCGAPAADATTARRGRPRKPSWRCGATVMFAALLAVTAAAAPPTGSALTARISNATDTAATAPYFTCAAASVSVPAFLIYPLADAATPAGGPATDLSGNGRAGTYNGTAAPTASKACSRDTGGSVALSGPTSFISTPTAVANPAVFTTVIWFKTTTGGGRLIGFGNAQTGTSTSYDRHLYLSNTGQVVFGVYNNAVFTVVSPGTYTDGRWHQAAATLSAAGMIVFVDGAAVASNTGNTAAQNYTGYWRVGYDTLSGWGATQPTNFNYTGNLAFAAVYTAALSAAQIKTQYIAGT